MANYAHLSEAQYLVVFSLGTISMMLSMMGSIVILIVLIRSKKWNELYHRLICGLSVMDLIVSASATVQPFMVRSDTNLRFASGNISTCEWTAFFFMFLLGAAIYNAAVSMYFMLMVTYGKQEGVIAKYLEPWVHIIAFGVPLAFSIAAIIFDVFNPSLLIGICGWSPYPADCMKQDDIKCERGEKFESFAIPFGLLYLVTALTGIFCTCRVFWSVRTQIRKNLRYRVEGCLDETQTKRIQAVGLQAMLYSAAFFNGFWPVVFMMIMDSVYVANVDPDNGLSGLPSVFAANLLLYLLFPLQGFLNCFIYIRPRYHRWRDAHPDKSSWWTFQQVLTAQSAPSTVRTTHLRSAESGGRTNNNNCPQSSSGQTDEGEVKQ